MFYHRRPSLAAVEILFAMSIDQSGPDEWPVVEGEKPESRREIHVRNTEYGAKNIQDILLIWEKEKWSKKNQIQ